MKPMRRRLRYFILMLVFFNLLFLTACSDSEEDTTTSNDPANLYDDFSSGSIDSVKWAENMRGNGAEIEIKNGALQLKAVHDGSTSGRAKAIFTKDEIEAVKFDLKEISSSGDTDRQYLRVEGYAYWTISPDNDDDFEGAIWFSLKMRPDGIVSYNLERCLDASCNSDVNIVSSRIENVKSESLQTFSFGFDADTATFYFASNGNTPVSLKMDQSQYPLVKSGWKYFGLSARSLAEGSITGQFDNVYAGSVEDIFGNLSTSVENSSYDDDFSGNAIDGARWKPIVMGLGSSLNINNKALVSKSNYSGSMGYSTVAYREVDFNALQAEYLISDLNGQPSILISGYVYGTQNNADADDKTGEIWVDLQLRQGDTQYFNYYISRCDNEGCDNDTTIVDESSPVSINTSERQILRMGFDSTNDTLYFQLNDDTIVTYQIDSTSYPKVREGWKSPRVGTFAYTNGSSITASVDNIKSGSISDIFGDSSATDMGDLDQLSGTWKKSCYLKDGSNYAEEEIVVSGSQLTRTLYSWPPGLSSCIGGYGLIAKDHYNITVGESVTTNDDLKAYAIDLSVVSFNIAPGRPTDTQYFNNNNFCGFTDWNEGVFKQVNDQTCESYTYDSVGTVFYSIYRINNDNLWSSWNSYSYNKNTRPNTLDNGAYVKEGNSSSTLSEVLIPGGTFNMGDQAGVGETWEVPVHSVTLSDFYISDHPVTAGEYKQCVDAGECTYSGLTSGSYVTYNISGKENHPINYVSWNETQDYINWLNQSAGKTYSLCTEAQWEYAARAGSTHRWPCGDTDTCLNDIAWFYNNSSNEIKAVNQKQANAFGVYDMVGNVYEWINDYFDPDYYSTSPTNDPPGGTNYQSYRGFRGGAFINDSSYLRTSARYGFLPDQKEYYLGFRVCASADGSSSGPSNKAGNVQFDDTDQQAGEIGGQIVITKANDESDITHYAIYWGSSVASKLTQTPLVVLEKTNTNLNYNIVSDTEIPAGATHFLVFTQNNSGEMATGVSVAILDAGSNAQTDFTGTWDWYENDVNYGPVIIKGNDNSVQLYSNCGQQWFSMNVNGNNLSVTFPDNSSITGVLNDSKDSISLTSTDSSSGTVYFEFRKVSNSTGFLENATLTINGNICGHSISLNNVAACATYDPDDDIEINAIYGDDVLGLEFESLDLLAVGNFSVVTDDFEIELQGKIIESCGIDDDEYQATDGTVYINEYTEGSSISGTFNLTFGSDGSVNGSYSASY